MMADDTVKRVRSFEGQSPDLFVSSCAHGGFGIGD